MSTLDSPAVAAPGGHGPLAFKARLDGTATPRPRLSGQTLTCKYSKRGTATRNVSMSSSRSGWPRWTSSERPRVVRGAIRKGKQTQASCAHVLGRERHPEDAIDDLITQDSFERYNVEHMDRVSATVVQGRPKDITEEGQWRHKAFRGTVHITMSYSVRPGT